MRWWHAVIIALGLTVGGVLAGGVYDVRVHDGDIYRANRLTGAVDGYMISQDKQRATWVRFPNRLTHELEEVTRK